MFRARLVCIFILLFHLSFLLFAQNKDSTEIKKVPLKPYHRNVLKFNPTPMLLWNSVKNITLSYERMVNSKQSFAIQLGFLQFPRLFSDTIASFLYLKSRSKYGINFAFDYRFYLFPRNTRPAPDGVYIGPYVSYYHYSFLNGFEIMNTPMVQNGKIQAGFDIANIGVALGYQFIFWKRFSLDLLLFGPSVTFYSGSAKIEGNLDPSQISELDKEIIAALLSKFPVLGYLINWDGSINTGYRARFGIGFRYSIQFGFHF